MLLVTLEIVVTAGERNGIVSSSCAFAGSTTGMEYVSTLKIIIDNTRAEAP